MNQDEFDQYLALLSGLLRVDDDQRREIAHELRDHLETRTEELLATGITSADARCQALSEFGEASHLAIALTKTIRYQRKRRWIMRTAYVTAAIATAVALAVVFWQPQPQNRHALQAQQESQSEISYPSSMYQSTRIPAQISEALEETLTEPLDETTLANFAVYLREQLAANVLLDRNALDSLGLDDTQEVSLNVTGISRLRQIELVLDPFDLVALVNERGLTITSAEEAEVELVIGMHPVWDLVAGSQEAGAAAADVIAMVSRSVAPDTWEMVGGPGSIEYLKGLLVIAQTARHHDQISGLLEGLRRVPMLGQSATKDRLIDPAKSAAQDALNLKLDTITSLRVEDQTLESVAAMVSETYGIPVYLDERSLDSLGLDRSQPVTFDLRDVPLREVLAWPLREYDLVAFPEDGVLVISIS